MKEPISPGQVCVEFQDRAGQWQTILQLELWHLVMLHLNARSWPLDAPLRVLLDGHPVDRPLDEFTTSADRPE